MLMEFRAITITKNTLPGFYHTLVLLCFIQMSHAANVVFILSQDAQSNLQFVDSVKQTIENSDADGITSSVLLLDEYQNNSEAGKLVVAVGVKATRERIDIENKQAIIAKLIDTPIFQQTLENSCSAIKNRIAGNFINHSIKTNIAFYSTLEEQDKQVAEYVNEVVKNDFVFIKRQQCPGYISITVKKHLTHSLGPDNINEEEIKSPFYVRGGIT